MLFGVRNVVRTKKISEYFVHKNRYYILSFFVAIVALSTSALYVNMRHKRTGSAVCGYSDTQYFSDGIKVSQECKQSHRFNVQWSENMLDTKMKYICNAHKDIDVSFVPGLMSLPVVDVFIDTVSHVFHRVRNMFIYDEKCTQFYDRVDVIGETFVSFYSHFVPCHTDYRYIRVHVNTVDKYHNEMSLYVIKQYMFTYSSLQAKNSAFSARFRRSVRDNVVYAHLCNMNSNITDSMFKEQRNIFKIAQATLAEQQILLLADKLLPLYTHNVSCEAFKIIMTDYGYCDCLCLFMPKFGEYAFDTIVCLYNFMQHKRDASIDDLLSIVNQFDDAEPAMPEGDVLDKLLNSRGLKYRMKYYNEFKLLVGKLLALRDCVFFGGGLTASYIYSQNSALMVHVHDVYISQLKTAIPPMHEWGKRSNDSTTGYLRDFNLTHTCAVFMTGVFNMMLTYILTR